MAQRVHEDLDERALHRLLFFTDAVFAIVMTLLVLELRPPEGDAAAQVAALFAMGGKFFAFALSFAILGIFWVAHLATTRRLRVFDWPTTVANLTFLFPICLLPFVSRWVGERTLSIPAWSAYSVVLIACSAGNIAIVLVQSRGGGRLLAEPVSAHERLYRVGRAGTPGLAFLIGLLGAGAGRVEIAQFCWVLIPPFMILLRFVRPKPARSA
jgi:hypothetical protein